MTTTPALGADIDLRALFEKLTAQKYKPEVARGLYLKTPYGSFQVSSIEMEFRAWLDGYRAALAAGAQAGRAVPHGFTLMDNETLQSLYIRLSGKRLHESTCATSSAPAETPGECDCDFVGEPAQ